jgi:hypothetical protein
MIVAGIKLEEIDDVAIGQSIVKVAEGSAENKPQCDLQQPVAGRTSDAVGNDNDGGAGRKQRKQNGFCRRTDGRKNSKGNSGISDIRYVEKPVYYRDRFVEVKSLLDEQLSPTVQYERRGDQQCVWQTPLKFKKPAHEDHRNYIWWAGEGTMSYGIFNEHFSTEV